MKKIHKVRAIIGTQELEDAASTCWSCREDRMFGQGVSSCFNLSKKLGHDEQLDGACRREYARSLILESSNCRCCGIDAKFSLSIAEQCTYLFLPVLHTFSLHNNLPYTTTSFHLSSCLCYSGLDLFARALCSASESKPYFDMLLSSMQRAFTCADVNWCAACGSAAHTQAHSSPHNANMYRQDSLSVHGCSSGRRYQYLPFGPVRCRSGWRSCQTPRCGSSTRSDECFRMSGCVSTGRDAARGSPGFP